MILKKTITKKEDTGLKIKLYVQCLGLMHTPRVMVIMPQSNSC